MVDQVVLEKRPLNGYSVVVVVIMHSPVWSIDMRSESEVGKDPSHDVLWESGGGTRRAELHLMSCCYLTAIKQCVTWSDIELCRHCTDDHSSDCDV